MRMWMKVFVLCLWTLTIFVIGNTMSYTNRTAEESVQEHENILSQEQVIALDASHDIQCSINHLLSSRYADVLQQPVVNSSHNVNDFKFLLRTVQALLLRQTDNQLYKSYKLTHSTHPYMRGSIDYYIYTLERILI